MHMIITGAGGFVGREVAKLARAAGYQLTLADMRLPQLAPGDDALRIEGDLTDPTVRARVVARPADIVIHLAGLLGGAAEADPKASRRVNLDATMDFIEAVAAHGDRPRVVYASTIAVFGAPLPVLVDDYTPTVPSMTYGAHKLMVEVALSDMTRRGQVDAISLRLPGVLARPPGPSGLKSAFMSEVFYSLLGRRPLTVPVSADATFWATSVRRCALNLLHGAKVDADVLPPGRALTLPALRLRFGDVVEAIARRTGADAALVDYAPEEAVEAQFGRLPPLEAPAAQLAGFAHDGDAETFVDDVITAIEAST